MFTLSLENVCKDYHLLIDGQESPFEINSKMIGTYKGLLTEGTHKIQIYKPVANESFQRGCLLHWLSALASSYDDNVISARRSHVKVNIIIEIDIKNQEQELIFDTYTNKVLNCSEEYRILLEEISEDEKKKKKSQKVHSLASSHLRCWCGSSIVFVVIFSDDFIFRFAVICIIRFFLCFFSDCHHSHSNI